MNSQQRVTCIELHEKAFSILRCEWKIDPQGFGPYCSTVGYLSDSRKATVFSCVPTDAPPGSMDSSNLTSIDTVLFKPCSNKIERQDGVWGCGGENNQNTLYICRKLAKEKFSE